MGLSVVSMLGVEQVTIQLSGHVVGVATLQVASINLPSTTDKDENWPTSLKELIVGQIPLYVAEYSGLLLHLTSLCTKFYHSKCFSVARIKVVQLLCNPFFFHSTCIFGNWNWWELGFHHVYGCC
jgi:hypothetical protein